MRFYKTTLQWLKKNKLWAFFAGLFLIALWEVPYIFVDNRIEWGDFSMFMQGYEAIRITVLQYGQFPWFNPWMAAGTPLYANPQIGVFSLQTLLVFIFGTSAGIKLSVALYTLIGYSSMCLLLRRYFKADWVITGLLSLAWVLNSFFIAHIPSHYTFIWYMITPLFIYLALTFDRKKYGGLLLGGAFAAMALSQVHNPFFHISLLTAVIILIRLVRNYKKPKAILLQLVVAAGTFVILAGHRVLFPAQNALEFPRILVDQAATITQSVLAFIVPYRVPPYTFIVYPNTPFGWQEITAYIGIGTLVAFAIAVICTVAITSKNKKLPLKLTGCQLSIIIIGIVGTFLIGLGAVSDFAPYNALKQLPIISGMRVSSRWFIFTLFGIIIALAIIYSRLPKNIGRTLIVIFLAFGVGELYVANFGYQKHILSHITIPSTQQAKSYPFELSRQFGSTRTFEDGTRITEDDGNLPHFYREYEATTYNIGTIQANDSFIDLNTIEHPQCGYEDGCSFVLSGNARVISWSPNKIVLKRTSPGAIALNMNNSRYFEINGKRDASIRVVEAYRRFTIDDPSSTITIEAAPSLSPFTVKVKDPRS